MSKYEKMYNSYFLYCPSIDTLMSSDKEKDPDVIPEDSSLLTLRYVVTVHSQYPDMGWGRKQAQWLAAVPFPGNGVLSETVSRNTLRAETPAYNRIIGMILLLACYLGIFFIKIYRICHLSYWKNFRFLRRPELVPKFGACRGFLIIMCRRFLQSLVKKSWHSCL